MQKADAKLSLTRALNGLQSTLTGLLPTLPIGQLIKGNSFSQLTFSMTLS
jgi:hypothetical protein